MGCRGPIRGPSTPSRLSPKRQARPDTLPRPPGKAHPGRSSRIPPHRLALLVRLAAADGDQHPVDVGRVVDVGPEKPRDHEQPRLPPAAIAGRPPVSRQRRGPSVPRPGSAPPASRARKLTRVRRRPSGGRRGSEAGIIERVPGPGFGATLSKLTPLRRRRYAEWSDGLGLFGHGWVTSPSGRLQHTCPMSRG